MTVVKLEARGLLYAPVAPTPECIHLVKELVAEHGDVSTSSCQQPLGHKVFVGPFARLSERAGLCCSKPVELSAKPPELAQFPGDGLRCSQRIALMPLASGLTTRCWTSISDGVVRGGILPQAHAHCS